MKSCNHCQGKTPPEVFCPVCDGNNFGKREVMYLILFLGIFVMVSLWSIAFINLWF